MKTTTKETNDKKKKRNEIVDNGCSYTGYIVPDNMAPQAKVTPVDCMQTHSPWGL